MHKLSSCQPTVNWAVTLHCSELSLTVPNLSLPPIVDILQIIDRFKKTVINFKIPFLSINPVNNQFSPPIIHPINKF